MAADRIRFMAYGAMIALLLVIALRAEGSATAVAATDSARTEGMFGLLGGRGDDTLFLVDVRNQRVTVYDYKPSSGKILLKGMRYFKNDFAFKNEFNSSSGVSVAAIEKLMKK